MALTSKVFTAAVIALALIAPAAPAQAPPPRRTLVVGLTPEHPPFSFTDSDGNPAGFNTDLVRALGPELGAELTIRVAEWSELRAALDRGEIDFLPGVYHTAQREHEFLFTRRYKVVRYSAFVREDGPSISAREDLAGLSVLAQRRSIGEEELTAMGYGANLVPTRSDVESLSMLDSGEFDCAIAPLALGRALIGARRLTRVEPSGPPLFTADMCMAVAPGRLELRDQINAAIGRLYESGVRDDIHDKWFGAEEPRDQTLADAISFTFWFVGPLLALLAIVLLWSWVLRRQVNQRTRELSAELAERRQAQEMLARSEAIRKKTEEISLVMTAHGALDGRWIMVPRQLCRLTGYSEAELLERTWRDVTHPEDIERDNALRDRLVRGEIESFELEKRYVRKDGPSIWIDLNCSIVKGEDGVPRHFLLYIRDITQRKLAQEALRRSEERYRSLVQATSSIVWTTDARGEFIEPQQSWERYTGQPWSEHKGTGWARMIHPDDIERIQKEFADVLASGRHTGIRGRLWRQASGAYHHFDAYGLPIRGPDGAIREWIGTISDVEDKLRAQSALAEAESRFHQMALSAPDVFWFVDLEPFRVRYVNPAFERIWGDPVERLYTDPLLWQRRIHPADRPAVEAAFERFISDRTGEYNAEYRVVCADGRTRWISDRGVAMKTENGAMRQAAGIATDITERKETERRQAFMMQELDHRVKNNLATVLSIVDSTLISSPSLDSFAEAFRGRVMALARSHSALAEGKWKGVDLLPLIEQALSPYQDLSGAAIGIHGPPTILHPGAATAISMTFNELSTNAAKYGAFSRPGGRVEVNWHIAPAPPGDAPNGDAASPQITIDWIERVSPADAPAAETGRSGLGMRLMKGLIEHELGGTIEFEFRPQGLACRVRFPLRRRESEPVLD